MDSCGAISQAKESEGKVANGGKLSKPCVQDSSWYSFVFEDKDAPALPVQEGHLCLRGLGPLPGKKVDEKGQNDLPASAVSSNSFTLNSAIHQGAIFCSSMS